MSKKIKSKEDFPYWPSLKFMEEAVKMAREKGYKGTDETLTDSIIRAYRVKRIKILGEYEED